jgi:hypothetical protein
MTSLYESAATLHRILNNVGLLMLAYLTRMILSRNFDKVSRSLLSRLNTEVEISFDSGRVSEPTGTTCSTVPIDSI